MQALLAFTFALFENHLGRERPIDVTLNLPFLCITDEVLYAKQPQVALAALLDFKLSTAIGHQQPAERGGTGKGLRGGLARALESVGAKLFFLFWALKFEGRHWLVVLTTILLNHQSIALYISPRTGHLHFFCFDLGGGQAEEALNPPKV